MKRLTRPRNVGPTAHIESAPRERQDRRRMKDKDEQDEEDGLIVFFFHPSILHLIGRFVKPLQMRLQQSTNKPRLLDAVGVARIDKTISSCNPGVERVCTVSSTLRERPASSFSPCWDISRSFDGLDGNMAECFCTGELIPVSPPK